MISKIYTEQDKVYIVGRGASLKEFDLNKLKGKRVIGVNSSFRFLPNYDFCVALDMTFYNKILKKGEATGKRFYTQYDAMRRMPDVDVDVVGIKRKNTGGFCLEYPYIYTGGNSGYAAINLAIHAGAKNIYLLGFDMGEVNGEIYLDDDGTGKESNYYYPLERFAEIDNNELKQKGINIYNCSKYSKIKTFEFYDQSRID